MMARTDPQDLVLEVRRKPHLPFISVPDWQKTSPQLAEVHAKWFDDNPQATVRVIARGRGRIVYPKRKKQQFLVAYGGGSIKQAQIAGEYPPPPVDMPEKPGTASADAENRVSGTVTGRWTRDKPPFHELYGGKPEKMAALQHITPEQARAAMKKFLGVDFAELERRILAMIEDQK